MFKQLIGTKEEGKTIEGGNLKVKGRVLYFANTIFQISNITSISIVDIYKPFPYIALLILLVGIVGATDYFGFIGFIGILTGIFLLMRWFQNRKRTGLEIITAGGMASSAFIISNDKEFLARVAITLANIMDSDNENIIANFSIDNREINIQGNEGANIVMDSKVGGDIINAV